MMHSFQERLIKGLASSRALATLTTSLAGPFTTIFSLHRAVSEKHPHAGTEPEFLETALRLLLKEGFQFISLPELISCAAEHKRPPTKTVCFTVDDGYADQADLIIPVLNKLGAKPTFFVITDILDKGDWPWDEKITYVIQESKKGSIQGLERFGIEDFAIGSKQEKTRARRALQNKAKNLSSTEISPFLDQLSAACGVEIPAVPPAGYEPMTWQKARELEEQGTIFAPHSCNHHITSKMSLEQAEFQFTASWARLEHELKSPQKIYCYPTGRLQDFDPGHEALLNEKGYIGAVSFVSKPFLWNDFPVQRFKLPRIAFPNTYLKVVRYASWLEVARSLNI